MCRNIRPLFNYEPPSTKTDIEAAALQFVRKISGYTEPSDANKEVFEEAVHDITRDIEKLMKGLVTKAPKRNRAEEIEKAKQLAKERFGK
jgi:hypothetical protein